MRYLSKLPKVIYKLEGIDAKRIVSNITLRAKFRDIIKSKSILFYNFVVKTETPEILAHKIYDNPDLYWIICFANDVHDMNNDWVITDTQIFHKFLQKKYNTTDLSILQKKNWTLNELETDPSVVHSFYVLDNLTGTTFEIDFSNYKAYFLDAFSETSYYKTYYEYEEEQNEKKRIVKIPKIEYIPIILREMEKLFN